jgi:hypothetical protein
MEREDSSTPQIPTYVYKRRRMNVPTTHAAGHRRAKAGHAVVLWPSVGTTIPPPGADCCESGGVFDWVNSTALWESWKPWAERAGEKPGKQDSLASNRV